MDILTINFDGSSIGGQLATDQFEQGRLTGAAWPHDGSYTRARDIHIHIIKNNAVATAKFQPSNFYQSVTQANFLLQRRFITLQP